MPLTLSTGDPPRRPRGALSDLTLYTSDCALYAGHMRIFRAAHSPSQRDYGSGDLVIVARALAPQGYIAYGILGSGWCWMCTKELAGWGGAAKSRLSLEPESNRWPFDDPCIHYSRTLCQLSYRRRSVWTPQVAVWHAAVYKPQKRARDKRATKSLPKSPWPPWKTCSQRHARPAAAAFTV